MQESIRLVDRLELMNVTARTSLLLPPQLNQSVSASPFVSQHHTNHSIAKCAGVVVIVFWNSCCTHNKSDFWWFALDSCLSSSFSHYLQNCTYMCFSYSLLIIVYLYLTWNQPKLSMWSVRWVVLLTQLKNCHQFVFYSLSFCVTTNETIVRDVLILCVLCTCMHTHCNCIS